MAEKGYSHPGQESQASLDLMSKPQLWKQLEELEARKIVLRKEMDELRLLISRTGTSYNRMEAISSLPGEVLSLIFLENMKSASSSKDFICTRPIEVTISHVCRAWREIALSLPLLWSKIRCKTSAKFQTSHANRVKRLQAYLTRSKLSPIDLWLDLEEEIFDFFGGTIFELILQHAHRWRVFSVNCENLETAVDLHISLEILFAPLVESVSIFLPTTLGNHLLGGFYNDDQSEYYRPSIFFQGAPQLSSICLEGAAVLFFRPPILARLTTVILHKGPGDRHLSAQELKELLQLPLLSCLSLDGWWITEFPELLASCGSMKAERLQHLRFYNGPADAFCQIIAALAMPNLETLVFHEIYESIDSLPQTPSSLPRLRCLTFEDHHYLIEIPVRNFIASICSSVRQIDFHLTSAQNLPLILFDDDSVGTSDWPNLTTITTHSLSSDDDKALDNYVSLRTHGERPIQTIRSDYIETERCRRLRSLNIDVQPCIWNNEWPPETTFGLDNDLFKTFLQSTS